MKTATKILYLYVETPLSTGAGSRPSGIDLPLQREYAMHYPVIQGSGIKGKLRSVAEDMVERKIGTLTDEKVTNMFGPKTKGAEDAGALIVGDARILLFPAYSSSGVFAYTTSFEVLRRFKIDRELNGKALPWQIPTPISNELQKTPFALVTNTNSASASSTIVLEEFIFQAQPSKDADEIANWIAQDALPERYNYWSEKLRRAFVILPDNGFHDFVLHLTEITTRVRIDRETRTLAEGILWTEECLPIHTLLYVPIYATNLRRSRDKGKRQRAIPAGEVLEDATSLVGYQGGYIQLGGGKTRGWGLVRMHWSKCSS